jgi:hypothetical protein
MRSPSESSWLAVLLAAFLFFGAGTDAVRADARTDYLVRILQTSEEFRVRAQAAIALGGMSPSDPITQALIRGLSDSDASVRAACAASLERVGDGAAIAALRTAASDREASVRSAASRAQRAIETRTRTAANPTTTTTTTTTTAVASTTNTTPSAADRYYMGISAPGAQAQGLDASVLRSARQLVVREASSIAGVVIAPEGETSAAANTAIRSRRLTGFSIEASVTEFESSATGTRVKVSIILGTYPGRDMRAILQGSATVPGAQGVEAQRMALEGAIRGGLRQLGSALARLAPPRP